MKTPKPGKTASLSKATSSPRAPGKKRKSIVPEVSSQTGQAAMVHDLTGFALIGLPPALRALIGDAALHRNALELANLEIVCIVREPGIVSYVHLPILVKEIEGEDMSLARGSLSMRDIVAPPTSKNPTHSS